MKGVSIGQTTLSAIVMDKNERKIASAPQPIEVHIYFEYITHYFGICVAANFKF